MSKPNPVSFQTTLLVRDSCLCLHVQRAARALARRFDDAFRPVGLTHGQFSLMMSLNRPGPASMRSVCDLLAMDRTTLTGYLKTLEGRGWVTVTPDPEDRRARLLSLTPAGQEALAAAVPIWIAEHKQLEAELPEGGPGRMREDLIKVVGVN
jgi:DNA-binding MarR family transcriptional regulator